MKILLFFIVFFYSCTNQSYNKRKILIEKAVNAISKYDTMQLYTLIDTSYCFDIYGKDGFLFKVNYTHNRFKMCGNSFSETSIKILEKPSQTKEYVLSFCRNKRGDIIYDSFDLIFSFADYESDIKILSMDVNIYRNNMIPTMPVPVTP
jgi:hypothetical protein